jgi:Fe-Mn family superoxide dismutase
MTKPLKNGRSQASVAPIRQEPLPYPESGLSPYISSKTLSFHYGKHHRTYVEKTNQLVSATNLKDLSLEEIIRRSAGRPDMKPLFTNAAQAWNHSFYWQCMKPKGGGTPGTELLGLIKSSFGSFEEFRQRFETSATSYFASGWVWLVQENGDLKITESHDADNPLVHDQKPLMTLDVWEHAYYLDYQNERKQYVKVFLDHLANWGFAESQLQETKNTENTKASKHKRS